MADIIDVLEDDFEDYLSRAIRQECSRRNFEFSEPVERSFREQLDAFLDANEGGIRRTGERRMRDAGLEDEEAFYYQTAEGTAYEFAERVGDHVASEDRSAVREGDFAVVLLTLEKCRFFPFC